jgi:transcriptional regulator of acetoin/glycerol metabolism
MITLLVFEDERRVYELLSQALRSQGYAFIDEPQSNGVIKIIKREPVDKDTAFGKRVLKFENIILSSKEGDIYKTILEDVEKPLIESILERTEGNQLKAAKILGINRNTLRVKMKKLGIESKNYKIY